MSPSKNRQQGSLHVICGPMFSGKSEELIRRLRRAIIAKKQVAVFKHCSDNRFTMEHVISHNGTVIHAKPVEYSEDILAHSQNASVRIVGIDEVQWFSSTIIPVLFTLIDAGKDVIVAGLDLDFRGVPFGIMATLLALADDITKLKAICTECGYDAHFSQRLVNNMPAKYNDPIMQIGAQEAYQARCRGCYSIDYQPHLIL
jgi:thymidine kinase